MLAPPQVSVLAPMQVRALLKGPDRTKVRVVDVRDEDFAGGHIRGCINLPSESWSTDLAVDQLIERHLDDASVETVVVHCYLSQVRGPHCARRLASRLAALGRGRPEVCLMANGWRGFARQFCDDPDLCEFSDDEAGPASAEGMQ